MTNINLPTLLIASSNPGKLREIGDLLLDLPLRLVLPADIGIHLEVEENGSTYAENAALKASAYFQASGLVTLADDSGLEVDVLGGAPGLHSARYSPKPGAKDADRRAHLLQNLHSGGFPRPWTARFRCTVAIAAPGVPLTFVEGRVDGEIWPEERGTGGFGYDPIFYLPDRGCTMAELPEGEKNHISHRGRAVEKARPFLKHIFGID
jgi:XTP/dITP diphosphohydrolase